MPFWAECHFLHNHVEETAHTHTCHHNHHMCVADHGDGHHHDDNGGRCCPIELEYVYDAVYLKITCSKGCCQDFRFDHIINLLLSEEYELHKDAGFNVIFFDYSLIPLPSPYLSVYQRRGPPIV